MTLEVPDHIPLGKPPSLLPVTPIPLYKFLTYSVSLHTRFPLPSRASGMGLSVGIGFSASGVTMSTCFSGSLAVKRTTSLFPASSPVSGNVPTTISSSKLNLTLLSIDMVRLSGQ